MKLLLILTVWLSVTGAYASETTSLKNLLSLNTLQQLNCDPAGSCKVTNNSGSLDGWFCRNDDGGSIRCYAEVEFENGSTATIQGSACYSSYSDCWSSGEGAFDPCD